MSSLVVEAPVVTGGGSVMIDTIVVARVVKTEN